MSLVAAGLACILAGSLVYCVLVLLAVRDYLGGRALPECSAPPPISVLKPIDGLSLGLADSLRSFFTQDYRDFDLLFAVRSLDDPAVAVVRQLQSEFPQIPSRLIVTGEPPYLNAQVYSLGRLLAEARNDLVVMSDSDIRVGNTFLTMAAAEFADEKIELASCPFRTIGGPGLWSVLAAEGLNTESLGGPLVARLIDRVNFAIGSTIIVRKAVLNAVGGIESFKDYLADDFMLGKAAAERGFGVILSRNIVERRIGSGDMRSNFNRRLRWNRCTRRSHPAGYAGQLFMHTLPIAILTVIAQPSWWFILIPAIVLRGLAAWSTSKTVLGVPPNWPRVAMQDLLNCVFWIVGFFGNTIVWRGHKYRLLSGGRFRVL
ncbi:MAG: glycosyltransferase [Bryobacteraceae bacterium]|jgi:ceramide glucosyltransferase